MLFAMHRRDVLRTLGLAATIPLTAQPAKRPNVLFIAVDDLRPELNCYGASHISSPNIDRLAKTGLLFERAYCQQAVCSPSRSSLMTGRRPDTTQVWDLVTHFRKAIPDVATIPQHFAQHGYTTTGLGKIYHSAAGALNDGASWTIPSWNPGRPPWNSAENAKVEAHNTAKIRDNNWDDPFGQQRYGKKTPAEARAQKLADRKRRGPSWASPDVADNELRDGQVADQAVECLRALASESFFLAVGFIKPHLAFVAPKKYFDLYPPETIELDPHPNPADNAPPFAGHTFGELRNYADIPLEGPVSDEKARELIRAYYACVSYMDAQVGRLLDELDRLDLADNTIVILWGDHGYHLGDHGLWNKHTNFERATHCPLLIRVPGTTSGQRTQGLAEFVDIYPSLCELAGLPLPDGLEGHSFAPLVDDPDRNWKRAAFSQYPRSYQGNALMGYSMRTDRYRYTEWRPRQGGEAVATELYDHNRDPAETTNLAGAERVKDDQARLATWLAEGWQQAL